MKLTRVSVLTLAKVGVLVTAVVAATFGLAQEAKPASASHTKVIFSLSNQFPYPVPAIVLPPGGDSLNVYVWAVGVDDPTGVSGFQVDVTFNDDLVNVALIQAYDTWLGSTERSVSCSPPPEVLEDRAYFSCTTIGAVPPYGPQGDGLLGRLLLAPRFTPAATTTLDLRPQGGSNGTFLLSTPPDLEPKVMQPVALVNTAVYTKCGDNNHDGIVTLFGDVLGVIQRFGMEEDNPATWPEGLTWDWAHDINEDGKIELFADILGTIAQFFYECEQAEQ